MDQRVAASGVEFTHRQRALLRRRKAGDDSCRRRDRLAADPAAFRHRTRRASARATDRGLHELRGVGENLHDHLQIRMQYKVRNVSTLNGVANSFVGKAAMALEYFAVPHRAPYHAAVAGGRVCEERPCASPRRTSSGTSSRSRSTSSATRCTRSRRSRLACATCGRARAAGCASSRRTLPHYPQIKLNYLETAEDRRVAVDGMRFTRRIMAARALARYRTRGISAGIRRAG